MREIQQFEKVDDHIEVVQPVREQQLIGSLNLRRGHKLFKFNLATGLISEVEIKFDEKTYNVNKVDLKMRKKAKGEKFILLLNGEAEENRHKNKMTLIQEEGYAYCGALNKKNAREHFASILISKNQI